MHASAEEITRVLSLVSSGEPGAQDRLIELVHEDLRQLARARVWNAGGSPTLQPTALVNEVYVRIFGQETGPDFQNRRHFFFAVGRAMRDILVENARRQKTEKRGGRQKRRNLEPDALHDSGKTQADDLLALTDALDKLQRDAPRTSQVVTLRIFAALSHDKVAEVLGISGATVRREWAFAKAWLHRELSDDHSSPAENQPFPD